MRQNMTRAVHCYSLRCPFRYRQLAEKDPYAGRRKMLTAVLWGFLLFSLKAVRCLGMVPRGGSRRNETRSRSACHLHLVTPHAVSCGDATKLSCGVLTLRVASRETPHANSRHLMALFVFVDARPKMLQQNSSFFASRSLFLGVVLLFVVILF